MSISPRSRRRWWSEPIGFVMAGGIVMGLSLGIRHALGIFMLPVTMEHGWYRETFSFAIALQNLVWGIAQPFVGMFADRFGSRRVIVSGLLCYGIGLMGMAYGTTPFVFTVCAGLIVGVALACTAFGVIYGALSRMVSVERRSWALGLAGAVGGLGQFFLVPVSQAFIDMFSWSGAFIAFAVICMALAPLAMPFFDSPEHKATQQSLRNALSEAFSHQGFWLLVLGFFACGFHLAFIANHLPSYLADKGMGSSTAVVGLAVIALANVVGTYWCGKIGGRFRQKYVLFWIYVLRSVAIAAFYFLPLNQITLLSFCAVMGFVWLGTVPLTNGVLSRIFGVRYLTTLFGFVFFGHQLGSFLGVWLGGYAFDMTRSYDLVWQVSIALGLLSALLHYPIKDAEIQREALSGTAT